VQSEEKAKSDGFCGYEVVLSANALYRHFTAYPVIIEFVDNHKNIVIGYSFIAFSLLLSSWTLESGTASTSTSGTNMKFSDKYYGIHSVRNNAVIRNMKSYDDLKAFEFDAVVMGNVRICCSLERFNIMNPTGISMDSRTGTDIEVDIEREHKVNGPEITESDQHRNSGISKANRLRSRNENQNEDDIDIEAVKFKRTENEIIGELKRWKTEQQQKWLNRLKVAEMERLHILETEFAKNEEIRSQQMRRQKLEIVKLEKKLKCSLYDVEGQEKKIKAEQSRLEDRRRELEQSYKMKTAELLGSLKRARNDAKMEMETLNRTIKFLQNENELISTKYRNEEKRCNEFRAELNKQKRQFDASSMGQLQIENDKLKHQIIELHKTVTAKDVEIEKGRERTEVNERKIESLQRELVELEKKQIDREKKEMERLKLELMAKSHFKQLRSDRTELQIIKQSLSDIMNQSHSRQ